ncbi:MAG: YjfB family protein [Alteromonadaceae bacterium]|nr:YjfB family protein [Alteromonadaceae bacterium]
MSLSSVGAAMGSQSQQQVMNAVNITLLKQSQNQQKEIAGQLIQSVTATSAPSPEGSLGQNIDIRV